MDVLLTELAAEKGSVRLFNSLSVADSQDFLPAKTVSGYVALGVVASRIFMRIPNMGRKTAQELDDIVNEYIALSGGTVPGSAPASLQQESLQQESLQQESLQQESENIPLAEIVEAYACDVRVRNAFSRDRSRFAALRMTYLKWKTTSDRARRSLFLQLHNFGEKSYANLCAAVALYEEDRRRGSSATKGAVSGGVSNDERCGLEAPGGYHHGSFLDLNSVVVEACLNRLSQKQRDIIKLRYFEGNTLEKVGQLYAVTRERIRQIEKKALGIFGSWFRSSFDDDVSELIFLGVWAELSCNNLYLEKSTFSEKGCAVSPSLRMACIASRGSVKAVLSEFATETGSHWALGYSKEEVRAAVERIEEFAEHYFFPEVTDKFLAALGIAEGLFEIALRNVDALHEYKGVLNEGAPSPRKRRLVDCWLIIAQEYEGGPVRLPDLHRRYLELCPEGQCDSRDLLIVLQDYPSLFQRAGSFGWIMLANASPLSKPGSADVAQSDSSVGSEDSASSSLRSILRDILSKAPLPYREIFHAVRRESAFHYSKGSVAALLSSYPEFDFFAPGVIGLYEKRSDPEHVTKAQRLLFHDTAIRQFLLMLVAGEPWIEYPAWTAGYFRTLVSGLIRVGDRASLGTLLAHSSPNPLRFTNTDLARFSELKAQTHERIDFPEWSETTLADLTPARVMRAAQLAHKLQAFSWIVGNRVTGERLDSLRKGPNVLMLLVAAGVLSREGAWFRSKAVERNGGSIILELGEIYRRNDACDFWRFLLACVSDRSIGGCFTAARKSELEELLTSRSRSASDGYVTYKVAEDDEKAEYDDVYAEQLLSVLE